MSTNGRIVCKGDGSSHGGTVTTTNLPDNNFTVSNTLLPAVQGAQHNCPIPGHGTTSITAITVKSFVGQKSQRTYNGGGELFGVASFGGLPEGTPADQGILILTYGATAGCGAIIEPPDRGLYVEEIP